MIRHCHNSKPICRSRTSARRQSSGSNRRPARSNRVRGRTGRRPTIAAGSRCSSASAKPGLERRKLIARRLQKQASDGNARGYDDGDQPEPPRARRRSDGLRCRQAGHRDPQGNHISGDAVQLRLEAIKPLFDLGDAAAEPVVAAGGEVGSLGDCCSPASTHRMPIHPARRAALDQLQLTSCWREP